MDPETIMMGVGHHESEWSYENDKLVKQRDAYRDMAMAGDAVIKEYMETMILIDENCPNLKAFLAAKKKAEGT
jgi:hypothetical protein